ncbi:MAG: GAF domain-containing protein [Chloroflexi bacterium]|nr:GAF domain-containing protein [Chloroflexota bacterium]
MSPPRSAEVALPSAGATYQERLLAVAEASREIAGELSLEQLLQRIVDHARRIVCCRYAALAVYDRPRHIQHFVTSGIDEVGRRRIGSLPQGRGLLGLVLEATEPLLVDDIALHPASVGFPEGHPPMKTFLGIPLRYRGTSLGSLYLTEKDGDGSFTPEDAEIASMLAAQAGVALENARLYAEAQHQAQEAIRERLSLEALLNSMPEGVYTLDTSLRITRVNPYAAQLLGQAPERLAGRRCSDAFPYLGPSGLPLCQEDTCPARRAMETGQPAYVMETTLRLPGGQELPMALLATAIRDDAGDVVGVVETCRDIRRRKEVDELRDSIISLVSHELRTPLFHIKGFASSLLQPDVQWDEETKTDFIRSIDREADRLARLVSDLLDMSRLESGRTVMALEPVDIRKPVRAALQHVAAFLRDHRVEVGLPRRLPPAVADAEQVERVLENLLENAAKYSPRGTLISVTAERDGPFLRVSISDQGVGVPEKDRERIFEKFVRLEQEPPFRSPGTGLGLSICKAIVEAHGGSIGVQPNGTRGSVFSFTLPLATRRQTRRVAATGGHR